MIQKKFVKSRNVTKVSFEFNELDADSIALIADFTNWQPVEVPKLKNGKWKLEQDLDPGQSYEFRYVLSKGNDTWFDNDESADRFVPNAHGTQNAVLDC
jgi:1,4-alpha-glucan branching enzyme